MVRTRIGSLTMNFFLFSLRIDPPRPPSSAMLYGVVPARQRGLCPPHRPLTPNPPVPIDEAKSSIVVQVVIGDVWMLVCNSKDT